MEPLPHVLSSAVRYALRHPPHPSRTMSRPRGDSSTRLVSGRPQLRRPGRSFLTYYAVYSLIYGPFYPFAFVYFYIRYRTLRYVFDDEGVTMLWGALFRREISLTYARIQDINLLNNVVERWFGLGRIELQTASGTAGAEMTIEGLKDYEAIRDELYSRMRGGTAIETTPDNGAQRELEGVGHTAAGAASTEIAPASVDADLAAVMRETAVELRRLREALTESGVLAKGGGDRA